MRRKDTEIVTHMPVKRDVEGAAEISQRILNYYRKMKNPVMTSTKWQKRLIAKVRSGKKRRGRLTRVCIMTLLLLLLLLLLHERHV